MIPGGRPPVYSFYEYKSTKHFAGLDGLRAISILLVIVYHMPLLPDGFWRALQQNGSYGVSLFFLISGFLISTLLLREQEATGRVSLRRFYARRALRLFPLYYAIVAAVVLGTLLTNVFSPESTRQVLDHLPAYLLYFSNWLRTATEGPLFFTWSLAAEEQFYLVFGGLIAVVARRSLLLIVAGLLVFKIAGNLTFGLAARESTFWRIALSCQEAILWGVLLGFTLHNPRGYAAVSRWLRPGLAPLLALACVTWMCTRPPGTAWRFEEQVLYPAAALVVASLVTRPRVPFLDAPGPAWIGKVSYGMYLIHWFALVAWQRTLPPGSSLLLYGVLATGSIVIAASIIHVAFERPIITYGRNRFGRDRPPLHAGAPAPGIAPGLEPTLGGATHRSGS